MGAYFSTLAALGLDNDNRAIWLISSVVVFSYRRFHCVATAYVAFPIMCDVTRSTVAQSVVRIFRPINFPTGWYDQCSIC
jgi:hypothetical protein